jgi:hypothetical protein
MYILQLGWEKGISESEEEKNNEKNEGSLVEPALVSVFYV